MEVEDKSDIDHSDKPPVSESMSPLEDPSVSKEESLEIDKSVDLMDETTNDKQIEESPVCESESVLETPKEEGEEGPAECQVGEGGNNIGRWSQQEHNQFLEGLEKFGKDWRKISTIVPTRTLIQIRTHAQKYFQKNDFGMKYDRAIDGSDISSEKRRFGGKKFKGKSHNRSNYQSTSKAVTHPPHVIMTRSRAPSPVPDEVANHEEEEEVEMENKATSIPTEYEPDESGEKHVIDTIPKHYNRSIRPSSMPLSSDDFFSRRITPLGVYYPDDRLNQGCDFATAVLKLIEKKAYEEEKVEEKKEVEKEEKEEEKKEEEKKEVKTEEKVEEVKTEENKEVVKTEEKVEVKTEENKEVSSQPTQSPPTQSISTQTSTTEKKEEVKKKVSIVDQIKPPPAKLSLRIINPDSLLPLKNEEEDYRADLNAPKTPANVRGNRSILHKAILSSEKETRAFLDNYRDSPNAIHYYVNQADPHGFTPLMTAVCLADSVMAMNLCKLLIDQGAELSTLDREGNNALMWTATVGNPVILRYLLEHGGSPDEQNNEGNTALHLSLIEKREDCAVILLKEAKCNISLLNKQRQTALDLLNSDECQLSQEAKIRIRKVFYELYPRLRTLVVHHPDCQLHVPRMTGSQGNNPWEAPPRIDAILKELHEQFQDWQIVYDTNFPPATNKQILRAHSRRYVQLLNNLFSTLKSDQSVAFTPHVQHGFGVPSDKIKDEGICDTSFSKGSLQAAMRAAGGAIYGVDQVMQGNYRNAFVCVRPPGHHAGTDGLLTNASSCGFCIFNNVMIAALHALETYPDQIKRIAIVDIDIHHGNGTEQILKKYNHPEKILFWSSHIYFNDPHHEYEFYPGTGKSDYIGNNIYNQPLQPLWETEHSRRHDGEGGRVLFRKAVTTRLLPLLRSFSPDLIIMSSGFDGGYGDVGNYRHIPTTEIGMNLKIEDYEWALHEIMGLASLCCKGRLISMLEGGYGSYEKRKSDGEVVLMRSSLAKNVAGHVHGLLGECVAEKETSKKGHAVKNEAYCGCGEIKEEKMIECASGRKCGGWVHYSCAGIDFENYKEDPNDPFICKWCRAEGVNLNEKKKEVKVEKVKKEEEQQIVTRARTRQKKDADSSYYGGYKRDLSDDDEPRRKTRKRARYSGYGNANKESMLIDEDYKQ